MRVGIKSVPFFKNRCHYRLYIVLSRFIKKAALETKAALEELKDRVLKELYWTWGIQEDY
jgi:hypothetical protein